MCESSVSRSKWRGSVPGGTAASVRFRKDSSARAGASSSASPSGELIAAMTGNRKEQELDLVLLSAKDGTVVRNLTPDFDQNYGFTYIVTPGSRWNTVTWMSWSPKGDAIAYFVRTEKERALIVQNAVTGKIETRIPMKSVDDPESPAIAPDGRHIAFSALRGAIGEPVA